MHDSGVGMGLCLLFCPESLREHFDKMVLRICYKQECPDIKVQTEVFQVSLSSAVCVSLSQAQVLGFLKEILFTIVPQPPGSEQTGSFGRGL